MVKEKEGKIKKAEAVRRALAEGVDKPQEGSEYIKKAFDLEVTPQQFSIYKSQEKKKAGKKGAASSGGRKRGRGATPEHQTVGNGLVATDLMKDLLGLVEKYGKDQVREALSVFGR